MERKPVRSRWWLLALLAALAGGGLAASLLGSGAGTPAAEPPPVEGLDMDASAREVSPREEPAVNGSLPISLRVEATRLGEGEEARFVLVLGLWPHRDVTLRFNTAQRFDFSIYPPEVPREGKPLWRWAAGRMFAQVAGQERYPAGQLQLFTAVWDGRGNDGQPLPPGRYRLEGRVTSVPALVAESWIRVP